MLVEQRTYVLNVGKVQEYLKIYEEEGFYIQKPILGNFVGYFSTEIGQLNQVVHMWAYEDLNDRAARRATLVANEHWQAYAAKARLLVLNQETKILVPAKFSPWANGPAY